MERLILGKAYGVCARLTFFLVRPLQLFKTISYKGKGFQLNLWNLLQ